MNEFIRPEGEWQVITEYGHESVDDLYVMYRMAAEQDVETVVAEEMMMEIMLENKHDVKEIGSLRWVPGDNEEDEVPYGMFVCNSCCETLDDEFMSPDTDICKDCYE